MLSRVLRSRWFWLLVLGGLVAVGWLGTSVALDARQAASALGEAQDDAARLKSALIAGEQPQVTSSLADLQDHAAAAHDLTDGWTWDVVATVPWWGRNVEAVQISTAAVDDIAARGLPPLADAGAKLSVDSFRPQDGRVDVATLARLAPAVTAASDVLDHNAEQVEAIDTDRLVGPVRDRLQDLQRELAAANSSAATASRALELAPSVLGSDGRRTYLLVFQTNAEIRSTAGMGGAFALVTADDGRLTLSAQSSAALLNGDVDPDPGLTEEELAVFGSLMGSDVRATNVDPHVPRVAQLWADRAQQAYGTPVDGVISLDAVSVSSLMRGIGAVDVPGGPRLTAGNLVDQVLHQVYLDIEDPGAQDDYFAAVTKRVFAKVVSGRVDWPAVVDALTDAADERRVEVWFRSTKEQQVLDDTAVVGSIVQPGSTPYVGLYVNDAAQSKMSYYLRYDTTVTSTRCTAKGRQTISGTTTFRNLLQGDPEKLPRYVTGSGRRADRGDISLSLWLFAPRGGQVTALAVDGQDQALGSGGPAYEDRPSQFGAVTVKPGQKVDLTWRVETAAGQGGDGRFFQTPGVTTSANGVRIASACR